MTRFELRAAALLMVFAISGCASTHARDPFEPYNRAMYGFNQAIDTVALKPAAEIYKTLPSFIQTGVYNFFGNLEDVGTAVNNVLQGKFREGFSDAGRIALNSTLGVGGLFDIATEAELYKNREDFGQTLGKWGMNPGPYVVLPLLGPSTLRDTVALPLDFKADPWFYVRPPVTRNLGVVVRAIDQRSTVLEAGKLIDDAALDNYQFLRDSYLQRRQSQVYDGDPPAFSYDEEMAPTLGRADAEPPLVGAIEAKPTATLAGAPLEKAPEERNK